MTDAKDTRDTPPRKRVRADAHTDWMQERVTTEHKAWLEGNGRLAVHHFTSGWSVHAPDIAAPETAVLQDIASAYNAKMLQTARRAPITDSGTGRWNYGYLRYVPPRLGSKIIQSIVRTCGATQTILTALTPFPLKKLPQQLAALGFHHPADDVGGVVGCGLGEDARAVLDAAAFNVIGTIDDFADFGVGGSCRAHGAGFERDIERVIRQVFAPQFAAGHLDGE
jgi:hypothetical protein